ncbi:MAG: N-acetylmuramoyl-L-alanine amidase [Bdellovibrionales bacterium]|nr:N-acetylmuramoyl-L-alanine amidase [Bdellovibrionales bacterium]
MVVLDPGHGGSDDGAQFRHGEELRKEKDLALGVGIRAAKYLRNRRYTRAFRGGVKVILTRTKDVTVPLEIRSEIARKAKADLFVSVHMNAEPSGKVRGVETYYLNNTASETHKKIEEIENRHSERNRPGREASALLRSVAADAMIGASREAATVIHRSLVDHLALFDSPPKDRGVRQALLYVLLDAQVPGVLVETLYMSNVDDLAWATEGSNRDKLAEGLAKGILRALATL